MYIHTLTLNIPLVSIPSPPPLLPPPAGSYSPNGLPSTALLFKDAVEIVAEDHSAQPWSYLLEIISETSIADPDVQSKALSLINKVTHTLVCVPPTKPIHHYIVSVFCDSCHSHFDNQLQVHLYTVGKFSIKFTEPHLVCPLSGGFS